MAKTIVTIAEQKYATVFLQYLHDHYSKAINAKDALLVEAVVAWFHQESGSLSKIIGNNPFNLRTSPLQVGVRKSIRGNGQFSTFATLSRGFEAAARLLVVGGGPTDAYGYRLALNALKQGGNSGAWNFLVALAMSKWDAGRYGTHNWQQAADPKYNHLLRNYLNMGGLAVVVTKTVVRSTPPTPPVPDPPPSDLPAPFHPLDYLDPWRAKGFYQARHRQRDVAG